MRNLFTATTTASHPLSTTSRHASPFKPAFHRPVMLRITTVPESLKVLLRGQLKFMSDYFDIIAVATPGSLLEEVGAREQVRTKGIKMTRSITPWQDLLSFWKLYKLIKKENPAVVHTHTPKAGLLGMFAAFVARVPVRLHTVAGLPLVEKKGWRKLMLQIVERCTSMLAHQVYPNSHKLAEYMVKNHLCSAKKIKVLGHGSSNGIEVDYFTATTELSNIAKQTRRQLGFDEGDFVFLYVGRLVGDKGINELVKAFVNLHKEFANVKLLMVGVFEQALDPLTDETIDEINSNKNIVQVSFQDDVRPYFILSQALVFPTYREGFPNVPMQAGCLEIPSIVTDINGCNEIVEHRVNGMLIPTKNVGALSEAMKELLTNRELYETLRGNSRQRIVERFDHLHVWRLILREYKEQMQRADVYALF